MIFDLWISFLYTPAASRFFTFFVSLAFGELFIITFVFQYTFCCLFIFNFWFLSTFHYNTCVQITFLFRVICFWNSMKAMISRSFVARNSWTGQSKNFSTISPNSEVHKFPIPSETFILIIYLWILEPQWKLRLVHAHWNFLKYHLLHCLCSFPEDESDSDWTSCEGSVTCNVSSIALSNIISYGFSDMICIYLPLKQTQT